MLKPWQLSPQIQIHLLENLVRPALLYGSDICIDKHAIHKLFSYHMCCILHVKPTTSNVIVVGISGQMTTSVFCHINTLCYLKRLHDLQDTKNMTQVYSELNRLHQCGVEAWVTKACEPAELFLPVGIFTDTI